MPNVTQFSLTPKEADVLMDALGFAASKHPTSAVQKTIPAIQAKIEKAMGTEEAPTPVKEEALPPMPPVKTASEMLDKIADDLETKGMVDEARQVDEISDAIEASIEEVDAE